jgi:Obg family GTPase CgtA-like protein
MLTSGYDEEKTGLTARVFALEQEFGAVQNRKTNANKFLKLVRSYTDVRELTYESLQYFQRALQKSGVISALEEAGVQEGDTVSIYDFEFEYVR